jgi:DNA-binding beta-propeller fold protein YncE
VFARTANGNVAPLRQIAGANTGSIACTGVILRPATSEVYVLGSDASTGTIAVFPMNGSGNLTPTRLIAGNATLMIYPFGGYIDELHGEVVIADQSEGRVLTFPIAGDGDIAPTRDISGNSNNANATPMEVAYDPGSDEIYVSDNNFKAIRVFDRTATGDVAPKRTIEDGDTVMVDPWELVLLP